MGNCMVDPGHAVKDPTAAQCVRCFPRCQADVFLVGCVRTNPTETCCVRDTINRNTLLPADLSVAGRGRGNNTKQKQPEYFIWSYFSAIGHQGMICQSQILFCTRGIQDCSL